MLRRTQNVLLPPRTKVDDRHDVSTYAGLTNQYSATIIVIGELYYEHIQVYLSKVGTLIAAW